MAKRELEEINAGSMADIAFLLLIFFLVTTTMNFPKAIDERLPQKNPNTDDNVIVKERNVLEILANANDQIMVEKKPSSIEEIKEQVIEFYSHKDPNDPKWPQLTKRTKEDVQKDISRFEAALVAYPDDPRYLDSLSRWESKLETCELIGDYMEISDKAMVTIQIDNQTKFKTYVAVLNEIMAGLNELRNDLSMEKFGVPYHKLNKKVEEDKQKLKVLRQVYPKRIMKAKSVNSGS